MAQRESTRQGFLLIGIIALVSAFLMIGFLLLDLGTDLFNVNNSRGEPPSAANIVGLTATVTPSVPLTSTPTPAPTPTPLSPPSASPALSLPTPTLMITPPPAEVPVTSFPFGLYDVPPEELPLARQAGFEFAHIYDGSQSLNNAINYLVAAQEAGLQVMQNMPSDYLHEGDAFWIEWVSTLAAYDNLIWWYMPEEPGPTDQEAMRRLYEIVREHDPQGRPAVLYFGTTHLEGRCDMADIILVPAYPEYNEAPRVDVWYWIDNARQACPDKVVVSVQALFDTNFDGTGDSPTPAEARSDIYTAIIAGSPALAWYSYDRGKDLPNLWPAVQEVVKEVKTLIPVITSSPVAQTISARLLAGPPRSPTVEDHSYDSIQILQKSQAGATYLLAVNLAEAPITVQFENLPEATTEVSVLFEGRSVPVVDQIFQDDFSPAAIHIYMTHP